MKRLTFTVLAVLIGLGVGPITHAQSRTKISAVTPAEVYPGNKFEIAGHGFGDRQRNRTVILSGTVNGRSAIYKLKVLDWSESSIRVDTWETVSPGIYSVGIYEGDGLRLIGNAEQIVVLGGIVIERITPDPAAPGQTVEIHGIHFGRVQANRIASLNRNGRRVFLQVLAWSETLIRARLPNHVGSGQHRVLIYYDDTLRSSSDGYPITIQPQP